MYLRLGLYGRALHGCPRSKAYGCKNNEKESETKLFVAKVHTFFIFFVFCPIN
jgi:hypothetical protein